MKFEDLDKEGKEIASAIFRLAKPVDYADLEKRGILSKAGAWYRVLKPADLPEHVTCKMHEMAWDSKGMKVKFSGIRGAQRLAKKLENSGISAPGDL